MSCESWGLVSLFGILQGMLMKLRRSWGAMKTLFHCLRSSAFPTMTSHLAHTVRTSHMTLTAPRGIRDPRNPNPRSANLWRHEAKAAQAEVRLLFYALPHAPVKLAFIPSIALHWTLSTAAVCQYVVSSKVYCPLSAQQWCSTGCPRLPCCSGFHSKQSMKTDSPLSQYL